MRRSRIPTQIPKRRNMISKPKCTGKSFLEALIHGSTNPQYEKDCSLIYQVST